MEAHSPAEYDLDVVMAIRALLSGTANEGQQKLGMDWIITKAANLYDMSYRPDKDGGARATEFHEGRRFVGNQIVKMTTVAALKAAEAKAGRKAEQ
ncbi:hypothetical protein [Rhizobium sp. AG207R]|uniref:hypothetical protein n=1 Tax=Rhizobium sp. AG207R TaxID=2802287 RepID=UPI000DDF1CF3|nr:hypothetical protein [Rhizobium sp. AG207R]MCZ3377430.1 hypothetical protein [Rhizobium sp. AG207R]